jgi:hypothetical protein
LREASLRGFELKGEAGKESAQIRSIRWLGRKKNRRIVIRGRRIECRRSNPEMTRGAMALSSGSNPTMEERLEALEANVQCLKNKMVNLEKFLQNLDIDAGRCMEMLENDITTMKFELSEELGKLRKDLKDPKKEFEDRVNKLEQ